jgi:hypothetical protein
MLSHFSLLQRSTIFRCYSAQLFLVARVLNHFHVVTVLNHFSLLRLSEFLRSAGRPRVPSDSILTYI